MTRKLKVLCSLAGALILCLILESALAAMDMTPFFRQGAIRVLILSGRNNHDWRQTTPYLKNLLLRTGSFDVRVSEEPAGLNSQALAPYDLIVVDYCGPRWGDTADRKSVV